MTIKTIQNLVSEAMGEIKTIEVDEAYQMVQNKNCNLNYDIYHKDNCIDYYHIGNIFLNLLLNTNQILRILLDERIL